MPFVLNNNNSDSMNFGKYKTYNYGLLQVFPRKRDSIIIGKCLAMHS